MNIRAGSPQRDGQQVFTRNSRQPIRDPGPDWHTRLVNTHRPGRFLEPLYFESRSIRRDTQRNQSYWIDG